MSVTVREGPVTRACTNSVEETLEQLEGMLRAKGITIFAGMDGHGSATTRPATCSSATDSPKDCSRTSPPSTGSPPR